jgi:hypothetical protein
MKTLILTAALLLTPSLAFAHSRDGEQRTHTHMNHNRAPHPHDYSIHPHQPA